MNVPSSTAEIAAGAFADGALEAEYQQLLQRFVATLRSRQDALLVVLARGETATALRLTHQLIGTAGMYGLASLSEQIRTIHRLIERGDLSAATALIEDLDAQRFL